MKVLVFTRNNAEFVFPHTGKELDAVLKANPGAIVNPNTRKLVDRGIPPHFWKNVDGELAEMTDEEKDSVTRDHLANGVDRVINTGIPISGLPRPILMERFHVKVLAFSAGVVTGGILILLAILILARYYPHR